MHYKQLDAIRGIAAIAVFFSHAIGLIEFDDDYIFNYINQSFLHIFWDGAAAVNLFFILSGFCISISYIDKKSTRKIRRIEFIVRRILRLYPVYIISVFLCILLRSYYIVPIGNYISDWGHSFWRWEDISLYQFMEQISLIGNFDTDLLNPPSWSLVIEMRMTFFLLEMILMMKYIARGEVFILLFAIILSMKVSLLGIVTYSGFFLGGILIAKYRTVVIQYINQISFNKFLCLNVFALFLYSFRFPMELFLQQQGCSLNSHLINIITGAGSGILIIISFRDKMQVLFDNIIFSFLGKISYALYLCHFPILLTIHSRHEYFNNNPYIITIISLGITMMISYFLYRYIELPCINFGKKMFPKLE